MKETISEALCPFCQTVNKCMAHDDKPCWCKNVEIPQDLLNLVPETKKRKVCICLQCIQAFKDNPAAFMSGIDNTA
ncbi:MAG: cysteine-rich CWC family protein [Desulfobacterales bacterium]|nr:cysteine-rich CWC family protein [Deltaproteobacteria bacterium]NNK93613.1 cysteine-rich CWC family protein [Desulfobacterales bacterium]